MGLGGRLRLPGLRRLSLVVLLTPLCESKLTKDSPRGLEGKLELYV